MTKSERIAIQTYLGHCFEDLAANLAQLDFPEFERSPSVEEGFISPDLLSTGKPPIFCAITATPTRNTFQKKKMALHPRAFLIEAKIWK